MNSLIKKLICYAQECIMTNVHTNFEITKMTTNKFEPWLRLGELKKSYSNSHYHEQKWRIGMFYLSCLILLTPIILLLINNNWFSALIGLIFLSFPLCFLSYLVCFRRSRQFKKHSHEILVYEYGIYDKCYSGERTIMFSEITELQIIRKFNTGGWSTDGRSVSVYMRDAQGDNLLSLEFSNIDMVWAEDFPTFIDNIFFNIMLSRVNNLIINKCRIPINNKLYVGKSVLEESNGNIILFDEVKKIKKSHSNPYLIQVISNNNRSKPIDIDLSVNERLTKMILSKFFPILQ